MDEEEKEVQSNHFPIIRHTSLAYFSLRDNFFLFVIAKVKISL